MIVGVDAAGRLVVADAVPTLARKEGVLVHQGGARSTLDLVEFIRNERTARHVSRLPSDPPLTRAT